ncbi:hypothetical protein AVDCRST_MAG81-4312 [uncultured Synechococcales cyanobacterium]|uniref:Uncharacterized protein n=1 Tax=uncultured Synechococcales cyanobacterium TaxID=1936017 RepID=A0A6J4VU74_9CYAN|nr:hypothetical protein AVDCRST_MAG81-4312 [uncultured Synechococcales cyanobacterium]
MAEERRQLPSLLQAGLHSSLVSQMLSVQDYYWERGLVNTQSYL